MTDATARVLGLTGRWTSGRVVLSPRPPGRDRTQQRRAAEELEHAATTATAEGVHRAEGAQGA